MTGIGAQGGAYHMGRNDYESGVVIDLPTGPGQTEPISGLEPAGVPGLEPIPSPILPAPIAPELDPVTGLAPGTFVNIAIGIAIGIVIDRLFLK